MDRKPIDDATLSQFIGTTQYYSFLFGTRLTDGTKYLCDNGCGWVMDVIASYQTMIFNKQNPFQEWEFVKQEDSSCLVFMSSENPETGETNKRLIQTIPWTDLSRAKLKIYCQDRVIFLPSEY